MGSQEEEIGCEEEVDDDDDGKNQRGNRGIKMRRKEHWQRSMEIYFREEKRKRDPIKLREGMEKGAKEKREEMNSYVREKREEHDDYARRFQEDVRKIRNRRMK